MSNYIPKKIDLTPKRHHGYSVLLFILGSLFPPLGTCTESILSFSEIGFSPHCYPAVAARFGIGVDFWLNLLLTICGYIPGAFRSHLFQIPD